MTDHILPAAVGSAASHAARAREPKPRVPRVVAVWRWFPRELEHRGRSVGREQERAYRDLQAAADVSRWRGQGGHG